LFDRQVIDDEIYRLLGRFAAGVRVVAVSDSCHSGTVTRMRREAGTGSPEKLARDTAKLWGHDEVGDDARSRAAPIEVTMQASARGAGSRAYLASGLQEGRQSASIHASSGIIWGIPVKHKARRRRREDR
jgi:hypothetical protein